MKRPCICFMGSETRCDKIKESFSAEIKSFYVKNKHAEKNIIDKKQPVFICIILEKGKSAAVAYYSEALAYSKQTRCPIYVICSPDQFYGIQKSYPSHHLHRVTVSGLFKSIRRAIDIFTEYGEKAHFEIAKRRFETVEINSGNASIAAYCADKVLSSSRTGYRIVVASSFQAPHSSDSLAVITAADRTNAGGETLTINLDGNSDKNNEELISELLTGRRKALIRKLNS